VEPGIAVAAESVLVSETFAWRLIVVVSVAELLPGVGSVAPPGRATLAVLESVPVDVGTTVTLTVNVAVPPDRTLMLAEMLPDPDAGHDDPADAVHVHVTPVSDAGIVSVTVAPVIADGPAFDTTIVYVSAEPANTLETPSVLVIDRSATVVGPVAADARSSSARAPFPGVESGSNASDVRTSATLTWSPLGRTVAVTCSTALAETARAPAVQTPDAGA